MPGLEETDDHLPLLTGAEAAKLLGTAVSHLGGELLDWSPTQVDHRPGRATAASYRVRARWPDGERTELFGSRIATRPPKHSERAGLVTLFDGRYQVQVWQLAADPELPGLGPLWNSRSVAALLRSVGLNPAGLEVRMVSYRPCRRAVFELVTSTGRLFAKVLRPADVAAVHHRLKITRTAGLPTPRSLGWSDEGILVLEALPGAGLREVIRRDGAAACSPDELLELLDRLPGELAGLPRRRAWSEASTHYAGVIAAVAPGLGQRAHELAGRIESRFEPGDDGPTHGDFYEAQLLAGDGRITGLLDVDTVGPGRRVDDLACMLAHLSVMVTLEPHSGRQFEDALTQWGARFDRAVDPHQLRVAAGAVVLSLATGPYRTQEPRWLDATEVRVELAERWLYAAGPRDLPYLRDLSSEPPGRLTGDRETEK
ncbi:MAG: phosphotransferase [Actinomycetota bacterium]